MSPRKITRSEKRDLRRQERIVEAATPHERLLASFDYLRGVLAELSKRDPAAADRLRGKAADQLVEMAGGVLR